MKANLKQAFPDMLVIPWDYPTAEHTELPTVDWYWKHKQKPSAVYFLFLRLTDIEKEAGQSSYALVPSAGGCPCRAGWGCYILKQGGSGGQTAMAPIRKTNHLFHYYVVIHWGHTVRKREIGAGRQLSWTLPLEPTNLFLGNPLLCWQMRPDI